MDPPNDNPLDPTYFHQPCIFPRDFSKYPMVFLTIFIVISEFKVSSRLTCISANIFVALNRAFHGLEIDILNLYKWYIFLMGSLCINNVENYGKVCHFQSPVI